MGARTFSVAAALAAAISTGPACALPAGFAQQANALLASSYPADGPGASVIVTEHGKIVYEGSRGLADIAARRRITPATVFRIGSITKQFAAATLLQLAAEGKLKLDDPISTYLPTYPNGQAITVAELLNHTSGIQDYTEIPGWMVEANADRPYTTQQLIAVFKDLPVHSKPGEKWAYNNSGYILVGALIEAVTHKPWYEAVDERIIRPLGLSTMRYGIDEPKIAPMARGYTQGKKGVTPSMKIDMSVPGAAGSLVATPRDLAAWADALHHGKVLPAPYYARMIAPTKLPDGSTVPYGFGVENGELRGQPMIGHSGGIFGFTTDSLYIPGDDMFVAVFSNSDSPRTPVETTTLRLAAMAVGSPFPTFRALPVDVKRVAPMLGVYRFKDATRIFGMRHGKLFTKRDDGAEMPVLYAGRGRFFYGPTELSWFAIRQDAPGKFVFERHADGAEEVDAGVRTGPSPTPH
jgi:D-alanyl-D-alanine carboxypeptidase